MKIAGPGATVALISLSVLALCAGGQDVPANKADAFVPYAIDWDKGLIVASEKEGKLRGQVSEGKLPTGKVQRIGPYLASDSDRVYLRCENGVAALDAKTGAIIWSVMEKCETLATIGNLLLLGEGDFSKEKPVLVVRTAAEGKEVSRTEMPSDAMFWDISSLANFEDLIVLHLSFDDMAVVMNQAGKVLHIFSEDVLQNRKVGDSRIFFSGGEVVAISPKDAEAWSLKIGPMNGAGGEWVELADKTLIVFEYGRIYDSGVALLRFDPATGKQIWNAICKPLGVSHSKYHHEATVTVADQKLTVHSVGSYGEFTEVLDLTTGKQLSRK